MAPLTKDAVETGSSAPETAVSQATSQQAAQTKSSGGHQRADAVSLEVPVKVHGSRVTQMVRGVTPHTEPFEEETSTMIVFPQGGVLRMNTSVGTGQMLVLTNLKSKQDAICRVLKVRSFPNMQSYVEVEFTQVQKGYWGVYFAAEGPAPSSSKPVQTAAPSSAAPPETKQKISPSSSWSPAPSAPAQKPIEPIPQAKEVKPVVPAVPPPPPAPSKPASVFAAIGTKEDVQIAADSTREPRTSSVASTIEKEIRAAQPAKPSKPSKQTPVVDETPPPPATALSLEELRGDEDAISSVLASLDSEEKQSSASTSVESAKSAGHELPVPTFGARLDLGVSTSSSQAAEPSQNWLMIAACIAVLFLAVGGGILYFRMKPAASQPSEAPVLAQRTLPQAAAPTVTREPATQPIQSSPVESNPAPVRTIQAPATSAPVGTNANQPRAGRVAAPPPQPTTTVVVEQPVQQAPPPSRDPLATAMNAHPVSSQRAVTTSAAPTLDPAANLSAQPGEFPGVGLNSVAAPPPPEPVSDAPQSVGGKVQQPRLISSVMPMYPSVAKQAHVEGDVVIDTQIDKNGSVVHEKVVSGPVVLRQAALDAVRRWKYQPSTLDGQPVSVQMLVTVKFRL